MADEAVLRIILQDAGGGIGGAGGGQYTATFPGVPTPPPTQTTSSAASGAAPAQFRTPRRSGQQSAFNPVQAAKDLRKHELEMEEMRNAYDVMFDWSKFFPPPPKDAKQKAQDRLDHEKAMAVIQKEYDLLNPPPPPKSAKEKAQEIADNLIEVAKVQAELDKINPPLTAAEKAKKILEDVLAAAKVQAEYAKIKPLPVIATPKTKAKLRRKRELEAEEEEKAYDKLYGKPKSGLDSAMDLLGSLRGTIGGTFGKGAGSALDAMSAMKGLEGAGGGLMASAGPIGALVAAGIAIKNFKDQAIIGGIKDTVGGIGGIASGIASPNTDPSVPIAALGSAASAAGEKLTWVSPLLSYMAVGVGETTKALAGLMQNLDKTAERYGEFSPLIAQQQAFAEVRQTMGDLRRAQEGTPELARYVKAQSDLQQKFEDIKIKLLTKILAVVNPILEILGAIMPTGAGIEAAINALSNPLGGIATYAATIASIQQDARLPEVFDPTEVILGLRAGPLRPGEERPFSFPSGQAGDVPGGI